jgi:signal peptidase II
MMLILYFLIIAGTIFVDQITKYAILTNMAEGQSIPIIKNVLHITYVTNDGAAMGMMDNARWIFMTVSVVAIVGITVWICMTYKKMTKLSGVAFSLIIGGGIGNMIDRTFNGDVFGEGVVVDFIDFYAFPSVWMWVFNVADAFVCVGAGLMMLYIVLDTVKEIKAKKQASVDAAEGDRDDV